MRKQKKKISDATGRRKFERSSTGALTWGSEGFHKDSEGKRQESVKTESPVRARRDPTQSIGEIALQKKRGGYTAAR